MSEGERRRAAGGAYLDSALEERLGGAAPPDLTGRILTATAMREGEPPRRSRTRRRLIVAALVLLGLAVVPAIRFLQEQESVAANPPQDPESEELVEPESLAQLAEIARTTERVSVQVHEAFGLPMSVPGEEPPPVLTLLGPGAIEELGWAATVPESMEKLRDDLLEGLVETANGATGASRGDMPADHVLRLHLEGGSRLEIASVADSEAVAVRGLGHLVSTERLRNALRTLAFFGEMTTRYRRGVYRGEELAAESARARRVTKLRLHDALPEHLAHLGLSSELRELDIRYSPALHRPEGLAEIALFPNLRRLIVSGSELSAAEVRQLRATLPGCDVERSGPRLEMRIVATALYDKGGVQFDLEQEEDRLETWLDRDGGANRKRVLADPSGVQAFNALSTEDGGPLAGRNLQWLPCVNEGGAAANRELSRVLDTVVVVEERGSERVVELVPINYHELHFTDADLAVVNRTADPRSGEAAIDYRLTPEKAERYADWSEEYRGQHCALILDGKVRAVPTFISRIPGRGRIINITDDEIDRLIEAVERRRR